jgi:hypothetical protein
MLGAHTANAFVKSDIRSKSSIDHHPQQPAGKKEKETEPDEATEHPEQGIDHRVEQRQEYGEHNQVHVNLRLITLCRFAARPYHYNPHFPDDREFPCTAGLNMSSVLAC